MADNNIKPSRKMAAILAADVVGYSKLMGSNEILTLKNLKDTREIIDNIIFIYHGRIFSSAGDSVMAEFASPVEAISAAAEFQEALNIRNKNLDKNEQIEFRVGVNLGDIMIEGDNLFGDSVNIAARIESIAEPGEICISEKVYLEVSNKLPIKFYPLGEKSFKNIDVKIKVYSSSLTTEKEPHERDKTFINKNWKYFVPAFVMILLLTTYFIFLNGKSNKQEETNTPLEGPSVLEVFRSSQTDDNKDISTQNRGTIVALMQFAYPADNPNMSEYANLLLDHTKTMLLKNSLSEVIIVPKGSENLNPPEVMLIATEADATHVINGILINENNVIKLNLKLYESKRGTNIITEKVDIKEDDFEKLDSALKKFTEIISK